MNRNIFITEKDFNDMKKADPSYYTKDRWEYMQLAAIMASSLVPEKSGKVLELGIYHMPVVKNAVTMDIDSAFNPKVIHDASKAPWPFKDKEFDLFVGLQVLEHLGKSPTDIEAKIRACREIKRVADYAIVSIPHLWTRTDDWHRNLSQADLKIWMEGTLPICSAILPNGLYNRYMALYKFNKET